MIKTPHLLPLLAALLLTTAGVDAQAQWAWRDANGRINASDRPPPRNIPDKDIITRPAADPARRNAPAAPPPMAADAAQAAASGAAPAAGPQDPGVPPKPAQDRELEARKRAAEQERAAKAKAEEERVAGLRAENCRRARSHLASLESGQRIARVNDKGEREILDDRGRADETRLARQVIASDCR